MANLSTAAWAFAIAGETGFGARTTFATLAFFTAVFFAPRLAAGFFATRAMCHLLEHDLNNRIVITRFQRKIAHNTSAKDIYIGIAFDIKKENENMRVFCPFFNQKKGKNSKKYKILNEIGFISQVLNQIA